jgi:hypothetical protein
MEVEMPIVPEQSGLPPENDKLAIGMPIVDLANRRVGDAHEHKGIQQPLPTVC